MITNLTKKKIKIVTPLRRDFIETIDVHTFLIGSYRSAEFNSAKSSLPPTFTIELILTDD